jgi:UDP-2-acetamido-2,6-beta-L-arabino-hexul-4-ose reductase
MSRVLVTGAQGFIGKNLVLRLRELPGFTVSKFVRGDDPEDLPGLVSAVNVVVHLAGANRPQDPREFDEVNSGLTGLVCDAIRACGKQVSLILASSTQAELDSPYGKSKLAAEQKVRECADATGMPATIFRLPGVFGKWSRPDYNSVVATFCHNIARDLPIQIHDPATELRLVHIDAVVAAVIAALDHEHRGLVYREVEPQYTVSLGELATQIRAFKACRTSLVLERVGVGFVRALYSTYVSFLPKQSMAYEIPQHKDVRGVFVEMLKTPDAGQFSYFTAHPGVTRGGHYHHTKTEKFLVIRGRALFRFRHLLTNARFELTTSGDKPQIVDTIPGWSHDITNIGEEELVVMLWANEIFDRNHPDTIQSKV